MSEFINNQTLRQEKLKGILRQLHEGKSVADVQAEFADLLEDVGGDEIVNIEQALVAEGLSPDLIKPLCDVHVAVFRGSLDQQPDPETIPGHPIFTFRAENLAVQRVLNDLAEALEDLKNLPHKPTLARARELTAKLMLYERHYLRKENILFALLERTGFTGPSKVMWAVHDDIRKGWKALNAMLASDDVVKAPDLEARITGIFEPMAHAIREMIYKEDKILFPASLERLTEADWAAIRTQEEEIGYAYIQAGRQWQPRLDPREAEAATAVEPVIAEGLIPLSVGALTPAQLDLMLKALPVDVTFVDEHDQVRYFSQGQERIFPRSPAIIGRAVQNCHPPQSVDRVQRIVEDFRAGRRDVAEFWIQMHGMFIHIRYFALRDADGTYRGTLEVSQNLSPLRALEGERRLLDE
ncbi:MAG: DUF438 domain-containing protein [Anaerolineae bacterium]|jgi:DUF438 domain-containing protein|nr:DUF438 domain-containing protein [Anaerolineae bacterium]